jgi:cob(I)alamin adenosyltransferase
MSVYTKTGDKGESSLYNGRRKPKVVPSFPSPVSIVYRRLVPGAHRHLLLSSSVPSTHQDHPFFMALGDTDELNACIGVAAEFCEIKGHMEISE